MNKPKVVAIVGPTASGKTSLSIEIAREFNGEVISADSRQVYCGMDLGSGKVTPEEMQGVPHHLLDIADPMEVYTGADYLRDARAALEDIIGRQKLPIIAGGTFFYLDLLRGKMQPAPVEPNPQLRSQLEQLSNEELIARLRAADSKRAETIDPDNRRRLIRAIEIVEELGYIPEQQPVESDYDWLTLGVDIDTAVLHHNIRKRIEERIRDGMIEEAKRLANQGVTWERMDEFGLEYRYLAKHLIGKLSVEEMVDVLEIKIRQFAKRQMTWLKRDDEIRWVRPSNQEAIFRLVANFLSE